jgi:hypothetical protein
MAYQERDMANASERNEIVIVLDFGDRPTGLESHLPSDSSKIRRLEDSQQYAENSGIFFRVKEREMAAGPRTGKEVKTLTDSYANRDAETMNPFEDPQYEYSNDDFNSNSSCDGDVEDDDWDHPTIAPRDDLSASENATCTKMWRLMDRLEEKARSTTSSRILTPDFFNTWRQSEGVMLGIPRDQIEEYRPLCLGDCRCEGCHDDYATEPLLGTVRVGTPESTSSGDNLSDFAHTCAEMFSTDFV